MSPKPKSLNVWSSAFPYTSMLFCLCVCSPCVCVYVGGGAVLWLLWIPLAVQYICLDPCDLAQDKQEGRNRKEMDGWMYGKRVTLHRLGKFNWGPPLYSRAPLLGPDEQCWRIQVPEFSVIIVTKTSEKLSLNMHMDTLVHFHIQACSCRPSERVTSSWRGLQAKWSLRK